MTKKEAYYVNRKIQRIKKLLGEITTLGWEISSVFEEKYGVDCCTYDQIPDTDNRHICETAYNCGMIETWSEWDFYDHVCEANE